MKDNLFILIGPTAIGKTALSIKLAEKLNGEIISADSMQIYKHMDIGSAKITKAEMKQVAHYLIDIVAPDQEFTVANFRDNAKILIKDINNRGKLPIIAGGTGLYINSLVYDLKFTEVSPDENIRERLESLANKYGNEYLHQELEKIDVPSAEKISINDRKRLIRAIEIYEVTNKPMSEHNKNFRNPIEDYNLVMIGLNMDRAELYNRINQRVDIMINEGLIGEVEKLISVGYNKDLVSMQGIGYKEIIMYLEGNISLDKAIELIKQGTRNYAKRQLTWFKKDNRIKWFNIDNYLDLNNLSQDIINYSKKQITI
ncbi:tRNA (adenosine(37)-N6)-dimethylallyltransferase MiaA [Tissierella sp.]|uniref:tRNA (adenosine(37)-N6)-dimethylallyltransferase MiaA n=1 Tax=Tissierella sp. TaxID=41274 RepID=UPI0028662CEA|nr:tRNA (adenosine(37)-N6)-dimethylallyltransferase MiaA [Tissierella sp.]MDR7856196.1 tRNA (adenosine(37)-N6)-dimethylallyltransferase MiaA [Tissierella sp.]